MDGMKEKILFKTLCGSKLYGTDNANSDTDIKGVFLPEIEDLILCKAPKHFVCSTGDKDHKNTSADVDECYYSLQYFLELLSKGDTNAMDMFFAVSNPNVVLFKSEIWDELILNADRLITRNLKAYIGYCKSQCVKYSFKGNKINNFNRLYDFVHRYMNDNTIPYEFKTLRNAFNFIGKKDLFKNKQDKKWKFTDIDFGDDCYIENSFNGESYLNISKVKLNLDEPLNAVSLKLNNVINSYGERAKNAAENNGIDYKAISHAVRVVLQVEEILITGKLTFPLKQAEFIKSIKYKTTSMTFDGIISFIEEKIKYIDDVLMPNSVLPEKPDRKWIDEFILKCYQKSN